MCRKHYPSDLTDKQWQMIHPLLPQPARRGRKPTDPREILDSQSAKTTVVHAASVQDHQGARRVVAKLKEKYKRLKVIFAD